MLRGFFASVSILSIRFGIGLCLAKPFRKWVVPLDGFFPSIV
jgi:hypothetical protein